MRPPPKPMKLESLVAAKPALDKLFTASISPALAFRLRRVLKKVNEEFASFEAARGPLLAQYAKAEEGKPGSYTFETTASLTAFRAALRPVLDVDLAWPDDLRIAEEDLVATPGLALSVTDAVLLEPFLG